MARHFDWRRSPEPDESEYADWHTYHGYGHAEIRWPPEYMSNWRLRGIRPRPIVWDQEYFDFLGDCRPPPAFVGEKWSEQDIFRELVLLIETSWSMLGESDPDAAYFKGLPSRATLDDRWHTLLNLDEALRQLMRDWWVVPSSHESYQAILSRYPPLDMSKRWMDVYYTALHRFHILRVDIDNDMKENTDTITQNKIVQRSPRSLLHLPSELLEMVISFCEPFVWDETSFNDPRTKFGVPHKTGTNTIKALRLTCRAISQRASLYLVREVHVALTEDSLSRLEQISHHPLISQGVRNIRLDLSHMLIQCARLPTAYVESVAKQMMGFHNPKLCPWTDPDDLPEYELSENVKSKAEAWREACGRVRKKVQRERRHSGAEWFEENEEVWQMLLENIPKDICYGRRTGMDWDGEIDPKIVAESDAAALRRGFELHQRHFQDHLAARRRFCDEVSQAMSRMPRATRLEITDGICEDAEGKERHWVVPVPADWDLRPGYQTYWGQPERDYDRPDGPGRKAMAKIREESMEKANNTRWQWDQWLGPDLEARDEMEQLTSLLEILLHLPGALDTQGVQLARLEIKTSLLPTGHIPDPEWEIDSLDSLVKSCTKRGKAINLFKNLQYLEFTFRRTKMDPYQGNGLGEQGRWDLIDPLRDLLSQAVSSPVLGFLKISMPAFRAEFDEEVQHPSETHPDWWTPDLHWLKNALFESQSGGLRWQELRHLELEETTLGEVDLRKLLESSPKLAYVSLNGVRLVEGSWYQVLEDLRKWRQSKLQVNINPEVKLNRLMNSDLPSNDFSHLVHTRLWGRAMHYVSSLSRRPTSYNPLAT